MNNTKDSYTLETLMGDYICDKTGENRLRFPDLYPDLVSDALNYKDGFVKGVTIFANMVHIYQPESGSNISDFISTEESSLTKVIESKIFSYDDSDVEDCYDFLEKLVK